MIRSQFLVGPIVSTLIVAFVISFFFDSFNSGVDAELLSLGSALVILSPVFFLMLFLRTVLNGKAIRDVAVGHVI